MVINFDLCSSVPTSCGNSWLAQSAHLSAATGQGITTCCAHQRQCLIARFPAVSALHRCVLRPRTAVALPRHHPGRRRCRRWEGHNPAGCLEPVTLAGCRISLLRLGPPISFPHLLLLPHISPRSIFLLLVLEPLHIFLARCCCARGYASASFLAVRQPRKSISGRCTLRGRFPSGRPDPCQLRHPSLVGFAERRQHTP